MRYEEEKPSRGLSAPAFLLTVSIACFAAVAGAGKPSAPVYWIVLGVLALLITVSALLLKKVKPQLFARHFGTDPIERGYELKLLIPAGILAVGTCLVSSLDYFRLRTGYLGGWLAPVGIIVTSLGVVMFQQTLRAYAPHDGSRYDEKPDANAVQGPYAQLRHPAVTFALLALLGVPLMLSSWLGLIGWALTAVTLIIYVVKEDRWRFLNYEWYYEYTCEVNHRIIPMIW